MTRRIHGKVGWMLAAAVAVLGGAVQAAYIEEEFPQAPAGRVAPDVRVLPRPLPPPPPLHVQELAWYLDGLEIRRALVVGRLAVFPVVLRRADTLGGRWWTLDAAIGKGVLGVYEREGGGTVPLVMMENRSRDDYVFAMAGEVISGGKQARTIRQDVILAPGQRVEAPVFCVEAHRWAGKAAFAPGEVLVPQSIQKEMRKGADQSAVWGEVARSNAALGAENPTGSLERGLKTAPVRRDLDDVRRMIVPEVPRDCVGFIFADRYAGCGIGAELFGRSDIALALLPKLIDAYAVDYVVQFKGDRTSGAIGAGVAAEFLNRIRRAGSYRAETPGSGFGIRLRAAGLVGDGVGMGGALVHFGCQVEDRWAPAPAPPRPPRRFEPAPRMPVE
jgi:hypothetical protein